jgi:DNA invertase Pin-like site-specific DNA recombinase/transposase-like protein
LSEPKEVAIYARVSTLEQAENNWSIEGQLNECREHCDRKKYKVVRIYKDKGESAATLDRPGLEAMLEHVGAGFFEKIVLWKYDRLSRDNIDFPALLHFFNKNGVEVESITEPTPNDGSPYNEFIVGILGLVSTMERRVFVMRSKMGMRTRLKKGFHRGSIPPYGYDYNPSTGHLEKKPGESDAVKEVFDKYLELGTLCSVRNHMNENGFRPRLSDRWRLSTVKRILTNRVYVGEYIYGDIVTKHEEVRIISDEKFNQVQERLKERSFLGVTNRYYDRRVDEYRDGLSFDDTSSNPVVQRYLQKKADMPPCPRCEDRMNVIRYGKYDSPIVGELQQYYCKPCNHEFMLFPELPPRNDVEPCPECGRRDGVSKSGVIRPKSHVGYYQRFYCRFCNRWFQHYPEEWKEPKPRCPHCDGSHVRRNGKSVLKSGRVALYFACQECGRYFTVREYPTQNPLNAVPE